MSERTKRSPNRIRPAGAALVLVFSLMSASFTDAPLSSPITHPFTARWVLGIDDQRIEQYATVQVQPAYPVAAQKYRIEGTVSVEVLVKDGTVAKASFIRGHSVFKLVSLEAAKQWRFKSPDNADLTGTLIAIFPVTDDTVFQTDLTMKDEGMLKLEIADNVLPKEGTPLKLVIEVK